MADIKSREKRFKRLRRSKRTRHRIRLGSVEYRLTVFKSKRYIYAQVFDKTGAFVCACASSLEIEAKDYIAQSDLSAKVAAAQWVGKMAAKRALEAGVPKVAFDRSGYPYHGHVRLLAESAREAGLQF